MHLLLVAMSNDSDFASWSNERIRLKSGKPWASASMVSGEEILFFSRLASLEEKEDKQEDKEDKD